MSHEIERTRSSEPLRTRSSELPSAVDRIGRLRIPLAGPYRPWASLYRLPDGRLLWAIRLWEGDRVESRIVGTSTLRRFADGNRLPRLRAEIDALVARATV